MSIDSERIVEIAQDLESISDRLALLTRMVSPSYGDRVIHLIEDVELAQNAAECLAYEIRLLDTAT